MEGLPDDTLDGAAVLLRSLSDGRIDPIRAEAPPGRIPDGLRPSISVGAYRHHEPRRAHARSSVFSDAATVYTSTTTPVLRLDFLAGTRWYSTL
jgi:hypothetical protein